MKYLMKLSTDQHGTVIDGDSLHRFIEAAMADGDDAFGLPELARYVAARMMEVLEADGEGASDRATRAEAWDEGYVAADNGRSEDLNPYRTH